MTNNAQKREVESAASLNDRLGLSFSNFSLLTRALTHRSYANEHQDGTMDNERLEYLGDAVLDFIVAEWAYRHFPELPEGDLTKIRAHLVQNDHLASFARQINLGAALALGAARRPRAEITVIVCLAPPSKPCLARSTWTRILKK
ncbi:MAG: hypothetical protein IPG80_05375 [Anaerolineales bacterium]|uniref:ribonuclease III family protein n=1 Tax=Candidatus Villigracilis vicinus TaxID=3140679 RepID=UPI00313654E2|nr:hypothetical protein [Anaerolineales bacterium]